MVGLVAVALVAGLLSLTSSSSDSDDKQVARRDLQPFRAAVDDLADAPGLRYKDTSAFGITKNDITVTASGSQFGSTSSGRKENGRDVLRIGGKTFMRWQVDPAPRKDVAAGEKPPPSEWTVGMDDGSELMDEALTRTIAPPKLAAVLDKALSDLEKLPPPVANDAKASGAPGQRQPSVNGTPALGIDTSAGRLLVSKEKPHRVLRLEAYDLRDGLADMKDQLENGETPTAPRSVTTGPLAAGGAEGMDLTPILADAANKMFDTLVEYADQLKDATDHGINFTLDGAGEMDCSPSGCTATQNFTGEVSSIARKERVTKGEVTAVMSATFSIDGKPAGQCTSPQRTFPVRGNKVSGTLKCTNPGAGPLYASVAARVKAQAEADARACGCRVRLTYPLRANTLIDARALAAVEAKQLLDQARKERDSADCKPGTSAGARPAVWHPGNNSPASAPQHAVPDVWHAPATSQAAASPCSDPTWGGRVTFLRDGQGRLHEMNAALTRNMLDKGTEASQRLRPPGFSGGARNQARGHLLANRLGGSGNTLDNLFTITQNPTNSPKMRDYEGKIYDAVAAGEKVTYNVYLEYANSNAKIPKYIQLDAVGDRGFKLDVVLENPAHKQE
ncbi:DNA/RNA non-specific endonuclease [Streptomyces badius]|uniref:Type VII secretion system protein EssD-like domain-containing protein n=1 Tax=Streptomyces badius TaxID=1941 RepID=A0ABQ2TR31_STRBA|nr:DNA/RNA non-specific endonuclease [Streptomyces badius]GGS81522.1 hypothetical protein GCM10010253_65230 [Streptomyces badius]